MNEDHGLTRENLLSSLPVSLSGDPKMLALAEVIAGVLAKRREEIGRLAVYPRIDRLDGGLLDILARDFKVDWWDGDYSLEEKRRTLLTSWQVHKTLGTKGAVIKAITSVYQSAALEEWFEYGGEPYHFRVTVRLSESGWDSRKHRQLLEKMQYYKNLRSHRDAIAYYMPLVTVENLQRLLFERFQMKGGLWENRQAADLVSMAMGWEVRNHNTQDQHFTVRFETLGNDAESLCRLLLRKAAVFGRLPPNRQELGRTAILLSWPVSQRYEVEGEFITRVRLRNPERASSHGLYMGLYRIDEMGLEAAYFDGVYRFDGERFFWYTFKRRPAFYRMNILAGARFQGSVSGRVLITSKDTDGNTVTEGSEL